MSLDKDEQKEVFKKALKEWMDENYASIGKWAVRLIVGAVLGIILYFALSLAGWKAPTPIAKQVIGGN